METSHSPVLIQHLQETIINIHWWIDLYFYRFVYLICFRRYNNEYINLYKINSTHMHTKYWLAQRFHIVQVLFTQPTPHVDRWPATKHFIKHKTCKLRAGTIDLLFGFMADYDSFWSFLYWRKLNCDTYIHNIYFLCIISSLIKFRRCHKGLTLPHIL